MYESFTSNKLQDNAEISNTFINKAVLTVASYTRTVDYKYNRIPFFYHLPFAFMETNSKMGLFKHTVFICSTNCLFHLYAYIFMEICSKLFYLVFLYSSLGYLLCAFGLGRYRK